MLTTFLSLDPPDHTRLRSVVAPFFTPSAVAAYRDELHELADRTLARATRPFDVVSDFACPYPFAFACGLVGARETDWPQLSSWTRTLTAMLDEPLSLRASDAVPMVSALVSRRVRPVTVLRAAGGLVRYARTRITDTETPINAALSDAVAAGEITFDEAVSTWLLLFLAGHETSANLIANAVHALATHPDELVKVIADPTLVASAVDETLRWDPPIPMNARTATVDTHLGAHAITQGNAAFLSIRDANRDLAVAADGGTFIVGRSPAPPHLSFGLGTHFCLGAFLARAEAEIGLQHLLERVPSLNFAAAPIRRSTFTVSGFDSLPLDLTSK